MILPVLHTFIHISDVTDTGKFKFLVQRDHSTAVANCSAVTFDKLGLKDEGSKRVRQWSV
jgi:hypothetical protein